MMTSTSDRAFLWALASLAGMNLLLIVAMIVADAIYGFSALSGQAVREIVAEDSLRHSIRLTLVSCTITAILCVLVSVPTGYLMSRYQFPGKALVDAILDIPIVLPPLVVGLSLLLLFNQMPPFAGSPSFEDMLNRAGVHVTFHFGAVILAQFVVACAFSIRSMRATFDQISPRAEQVALTLGRSRAGAFFSVVIPEAERGIFKGGTLAWARAMGEFGPILVFAGTIQNRTEVLSSTVFLEITTGNLEAAVFVSLLMVGISIMVLVAVRFCDRNPGVAAP